MEQFIIVGSIGFTLFTTREIIDWVRYTTAQKTYRTLNNFKLFYEDIKPKVPRINNARTKIPIIGKSAKQS